MSNAINEDADDIAAVAAARAEETRRKQGSVETLDRIARALGVPIEALIEDKGE